MEEGMRAFMRHLDSLEETDGFSKEFNSIKKQLASIGDHPDFCTEAGKVRGNAKKNRYKDILPFDQTRVPLTLLLDECYSDYINANFIRGVDGELNYIATQGPLSQTVVDFWRMIWEFRVKVIAMACREIELGKKKCERYWATEEAAVTFGPFTISNVGEETLRNEVTIRTLSVTLLGETRSVSQFQYTAWPDHGIPQEFECLLEMIGLVHQRQDKQRAPICVHCSAGCGRTGVICTVDYVRSLLHRKLIGKEFNLEEIVRQIRLQRPAAVQTKDQYEFVYRIVAAMFRRELAGEEPNYENWKEGRRVSLIQDVNQSAVSKPSVWPKPLSLPKKATRPQPADPMPTDGSAGDTYAVVARPKAGTSRPVSSPSPRADYENLGLCDKAPTQQLLYSTVIAKERPRQPTAQTQYANLTPPSKAKEPSLSYATIEFGAAGQGSSAVDNDVDDENWAPTLPRRTSDSYVVQDPDQSRGILSPSDERKSPSKLRNNFQQGIAATQGNKVPDATDDGYEDVGSLSSPDCAFSSSKRLDYNNRVSKPKGPRDPPEEWSCYER